MEKACQALFDFCEIVASAAWRLLCFSVQRRPAVVGPRPQALLLLLQCQLLILIKTPPVVVVIV